MHRHFPDHRQLVRVDRHTLPVSFELEDDLLAPEDQQVGVLRDDTIDVALPLEETKLSIRLVGRDDVVDIFGA